MYDQGVIEAIKMRIKLTKREIKELKKQLINKGVSMHRLNPKSMDIE